MRRPLPVLGQIGSSAQSVKPKRLTRWRHRRDFGSDYPTAAIFSVLTDIGASRTSRDVAWIAAGKSASPTGFTK
jgi:hypothetical protein